MLMRNFRRLLVIAACGATPMLHAENLVIMQFGPMWPRTLWDEQLPQEARQQYRRTALDATLQYQYLFDWRVGFGCGGDFIWCTFTDEKKNADGTRYVAYYRRDFMFPVYGCLTIDPIPQFMLHPALRGEIGYNSLIYAKSRDDGYDLLKEPQLDEELSGYYFGLFGRLSLDANADFSENVGAIVSISYQFANTRSAKEEAGSYRRRDMSGMGLHAGFRFFF